MELICTVRTPAAAKDAVYAGADSVCLNLPIDPANKCSLEYCPWSSDVDAAIRLAQEAGVRVYMAIDSYAPEGSSDLWKGLLSRAETAAVDAVILTEIPLLDYAKAHHPRLRLHTAMPIAAATPQVVSFYANLYGVRRIALPIIDLACFRDIFPDGFPIETEALVLNANLAHAHLSRRHPTKNKNAGVKAKNISPMSFSLQSSLSWSSPHAPLSSAGFPKPLTLWQKPRLGSMQSAADQRGYPFEPRKLVSDLRRARTTSLNVEFHGGPREAIRDTIAALRRAIDGKVTRH